MESAFQFSNPSLTKMEFCINEDFENGRNKEVKMAVNMGIQIDRSKVDNSAKVSLTLEIGKKGASDPFYVCATEMAEFRWPDSLNMGMIEKLLNQNAPSLLLGYLRPIISQITAASPYNAYNLPFIDFSEKSLGIWIESCNIQKIEDENNLITALGQDNMSQIQKDASVAKAQADRDVAIARAQAQKDANDAQVIAETEIAQKQTELAIKKAELKKESDIKKAEADAAYKIQEEEQRKTVEITTANANLARQEKELELKEREVSIKEKALEAEVKKTAEANKYAAQQKADAEQYERQKRAEAELFEIQRQAEAEKAKSEAERFAKEQAAEAVKAAGLAEAAAVAAKGKAEAEAIQAKAEAEAAGILKKAEAMKQYGDAARQQMELDTLKVYFEQLPKIAEAVAKGYMNVDSIKMFGGDSSKLAGDIMTTVTQVTDGIKESTGLDINEMLAKGFAKETKSEETGSTANADYHEVKPE